MPGQRFQRAEIQLCMGCMEFKRSGACPNPRSCGWIEGTPNPSQLQLQPRAGLVGRYIIGRVLGNGGFGITYIAYDLVDRCKRAIKEYFPSSLATRKPAQETVIHSDVDTKEAFEYGLKKFAREAQTLARLRGHANILAVIDYVEGNGTGYIVMEYLDGRTLAKHLSEKEHGRISIEECLIVVKPVMLALEQVHGANITHRDVSPDNIMMCTSGAVKLIDFGAAKQVLLDPRTQQLILKAGYTPWEQYLTDGVPGPWTDVYSLGATIYRCITGITPPEAPLRLKKDTLVPPRERGTQLSEVVEQALMRALSIKAKDRYQTIAEFRRELIPDVPDPEPLPEIQVTEKPTLFARFLMFFGPLFGHSGNKPPPPLKLGLRFRSGQEATNTFQVDAQPITIGRDPAKAHLIIESPQVSGTHARVRSTPDASHLQVEDLDSRNGTYIKRSGLYSHFERLHGLETLKVGDRFYICDEHTAEFEVVDLGA